jgi:hypothetical protein
MEPYWYILQSGWTMCPHKEERTKGQSHLTNPFYEALMDPWMWSCHDIKPPIFYTVALWSKLQHEFGESKYSNHSKHVPPARPDGVHVPSPSPFQLLPPAICCLREPKKLFITIPCSWICKFCTVSTFISYFPPLKCLQHLTNPVTTLTSAYLSPLVSTMISGCWVQYSSCELSVAIKP